MPEAAKKRVLVIDDAGLVRLYYRTTLEAAGYQVEEALNGVEAIEKLLQSPVDFAVVDVNMPQMDGLSFLKLLRRQAQPLMSIPAIVITTESENHDRTAARKAGANHYLVKPVRQDDLLDYAALLSGTPR
jgi:two-component system chemotaxis response regulator CheY